MTPTPARLPPWLWLVPVLWSGAFLTGDRALRALSPATVSFARFAIAAVVAAPILGPSLRGALRQGVSAAAWRAIALLCAVGGVLYHLLFYAGLSRSTGPVASVIIAMIPIFTALGSALFLRDRRVGLAQLAGVALAFAGVCSLASDKPGLAGGLAFRLAHSWGAGESLCLLAAAAWSAYVLLLQHLRAGPLRALPGGAVTLLHYALTALGTLPFALADGGLRALAAADGTTWLCLAYVGVASTVAAYTLYNAALDRVGSARVAQVAYLVPALTTGLSWMLHRDAHFTARTALGLSLVALGLLTADGALARVRSSPSTSRSRA